MLIAIKVEALGQHLLLCAGQADLLEKKSLYMDFQEAQDKLRETNARLVQGRQRLQEIKNEIARDAAPLV